MRQLPVGYNTSRRWTVGLESRSPQKTLQRSYKADSIMYRCIINRLKLEKAANLLQGKDGVIFLLFQKPSEVDVNM